MDEWTNATRRLHFLTYRTPEKGNNFFSLTFSHTMKKKTVTATRWANIKQRQTSQDQSIQGFSCKHKKKKEETKEINK